jgi:mRNA interferase RelE/StbE
MAVYKVLFKRSVWKDFDCIPPKELRKILEKIESLAMEPRPIGCQKLSGQEKYRLRQGRYRILYSIQEEEITVWVIQVAHRKDAYR